MEQEVEYVAEGLTKEERAHRISEVLVVVNPGDPDREDLAWNVRFMAELRMRKIWPPANVI